MKYLKKSLKKVCSYATKIKNKHFFANKTRTSEITEIFPQEALLFKQHYCCFVILSFLGESKRA